MPEIEYPGQDVQSFEARIKEVQIGGCRLLMLPVEVEDVVSWQGSFVSNPDFGAREELVQSLVVSLLDKGTEERDKFEIADILENKGAQIRFRQRGTRIGFSGQALKDDFAEVFDIFAEQLFIPEMANDEFEKARMRTAASIQRNKDQSGARASLALRQLIYGSAHPNFSYSHDDELALLESAEVETLRRYHATHFGSNDAILVVVGDIDVDQVEAVVTAHLADWDAHSAAAVYDDGFTASKPKHEHVQMNDKFNLDVRFGHMIDIRRHHEDFIPLYIGDYILGGNFSSRLMDVIRDEMGLTYGVHSVLNGVSKDYNGHWQISITLSQDKLKEGIKATKELVETFVEKGVTPEEVEEKKETIAGTYKVQLGTTNGLAGAILRSLERGFERSRLDTFPAQVRSASADEVNRVLKKYLDPSALHIVSAGTKD